MSSTSQQEQPTTQSVADACSTSAPAAVSGASGSTTSTTTPSASYASTVLRAFQVIWSNEIHYDQDKYAEEARIIDQRLQDMHHHLVSCHSSVFEQYISPSFEQVQQAKANSSTAFTATTASQTVAALKATTSSGSNGDQVSTTVVDGKTVPVYDVSAVVDAAFEQDLLLQQEQMVKKQKTQAATSTQPVNNPSNKGGKGVGPSTGKQTNTSGSSSSGSGTAKQQIQGQQAVLTENEKKELQYQLLLEKAILIDELEFDSLEDYTPEELIVYHSLHTQTNYLIQYSFMEKALQMRKKLPIFAKSFDRFVHFLRCRSGKTSTPSNQNNESEVTHAMLYQLPLMSKYQEQIVFFSQMVHCAIIAVIEKMDDECYWMHEGVVRHLSSTSNNHLITSLTSVMTHDFAQRVASIGGVVMGIGSCGANGSTSNGCGNSVSDSTTSEANTATTLATTITNTTASTVTPIKAPLSLPPPTNIGTVSNHVSTPKESRPRDEDDDAADKLRDGEVDEGEDDEDGDEEHEEGDNEDGDNEEGEGEVEEEEEDDTRDMRPFYYEYVDFVRCYTDLMKQMDAQMTLWDDLMECFQLIIGLLTGTTVSTSNKKLSTMSFTELIDKVRHSFHQTIPLRMKNIGIGMDNMNMFLAEQISSDCYDLAANRGLTGEVEIAKLYRRAGYLYEISFAVGNKMSMNHHYHNNTTGSNVTSNSNSTGSKYLDKLNARLARYYRKSGLVSEHTARAYDEGQGKDIGQQYIAVSIILDRGIDMLMQSMLTFGEMQSLLYCGNTSVSDVNSNPKKTINTNPSNLSSTGLNGEQILLATKKRLLSVYQDNLSKANYLLGEYMFLSIVEHKLSISKLSMNNVHKSMSFHTRDKIMSLYHQAIEHLKLGVQYWREFVFAFNNKSIKTVQMLVQSLGLPMSIQVMLDPEEEEWMMKQVIPPLRHQQQQQLNQQTHVSLLSGNNNPIVLGISGFSFYPAETLRYYFLYLRCTFHCLAGTTYGKSAQEKRLHNSECKQQKARLYEKAIVFIEKGLTAINNNEYLFANKIMELIMYYSYVIKFMSKIESYEHKHYTEKVSLCKKAMPFFQQAIISFKHALSYYEYGSRVIADAYMTLANEQDMIGKSLVRLVKYLPRIKESGNLINLDLWSYNEALKASDEIKDCLERDNLEIADYYMQLMLILYAIGSTKNELLYKDKKLSFNKLAITFYEKALYNNQLAINSILIDHNSSGHISGHISGNNSGNNSVLNGPQPYQHITGSKREELAKYQLSLATYQQYIGEAAKCLQKDIDSHMDIFHQAFVKYQQAATACEICIGLLTSTTTATDSNVPASDSDSNVTGSNVNSNDNNADNTMATNVNSKIDANGEEGNPFAPPVDSTITSTAMAAATLSSLDDIAQSAHKYQTAACYHFLSQFHHLIGCIIVKTKECNDEIHSIDCTNRGLTLASTVTSRFVEVINQLERAVKAMEDAIALLDHTKDNMNSNTTADVLKMLGDHIVIASEYYSIAKVEVRLIETINSNLLASLHGSHNNDSNASGNNVNRNRIRTGSTTTLEDGERDDEGGVEENEREGEEVEHDDNDHDNDDDSEDEEGQQRYYATIAATSLAMPWSFYESIREKAFSCCSDAVRHCDLAIAALSSHSTDSVDDHIALAGTRIKLAILHGDFLELSLSFANLLSPNNGEGGIGGTGVMIGTPVYHSSPHHYSSSGMAMLGGVHSLSPSSFGCSLSSTHSLLSSTVSSSATTSSLFLRGSVGSATSASMHTSYLGNNSLFLQHYGYGNTVNTALGGIPPSTAIPAIHSQTAMANSAAIVSLYKKALTAYEEVSLYESIIASDAIQDEVRKIITAIAEYYLKAANGYHEAFEYLLEDLDFTYDATEIVVQMCTNAGTFYEQAGSTCRGILTLLQQKTGSDSNTGNISGNNSGNISGNNSEGVLGEDDRHLLSLVEDYRLLSLYSARAGDASKKVVDIISDFSLEEENDIIGLFCEKVLPLYTKAVRSLQRVINELTHASEEHPLQPLDITKRCDVDYHRYLTECAFKAGYAYHESIENDLNYRVIQSCHSNTTIEVNRMRQNEFSAKLLRESGNLFEKVLQLIELKENEIKQGFIEGMMKNSCSTENSGNNNGLGGLILPEDIKLMLKNAEEAYQLGNSLLEDIPGLSF